MTLRPSSLRATHILLFFFSLIVALTLYIKILYDDLCKKMIILILAIVKALNIAQHRSQGVLTSCADHEAELKP